MDRTTPMTSPPSISRRSLLGSAAALGLGGRAAFAQGLAEPADVLAAINVGHMVKKAYREQFRLGDDDLLWDPRKDWIRTVDWEQLRREHSGKMVRFATGAAGDAPSARWIAPFEQLSGIRVVPVTATGAVLQGGAPASAGFDAAEIPSRAFGDFAAGGLLKPLDDDVAKWKLPFDDVYATHALNDGRWSGRSILGLPFDCGLHMIHIRPSVFQKIGIDADAAMAIETYDDLLRIAPDLNKSAMGVGGLGLACAAGLPAAVTWQHIAAQYGVDLFGPDWQPAFNGEPGVKGLETLVALSRHAAADAAAADTGATRAAWLGGRIACVMAPQDWGTEATRPDLSAIGDDVLTIYEPRVTGGRFAPPNMGGSTLCVSVASPEPEAAFLFTAYLTTASLLAMNEANASGAKPGSKSVLGNAKLQAVSEPAGVWADSLNYAWCAPRLPGSFEIQRQIGLAVNMAVMGRMTAKAALDAAASDVRAIMAGRGFYRGRDPMSFAATAPGLWAGRGKPLPF